MSTSESSNTDNDDAPKSVDPSNNDDEPSTLQKALIYLHRRIWTPLRNIVTKIGPEAVFFMFHTFGIIVGAILLRPNVYKMISSSPKFSKASAFMWFMTTVAFFDIIGYSMILLIMGVLIRSKSKEFMRTTSFFLGCLMGVGITTLLHWYTVQENPFWSGANNKETLEPSVLTTYILTLYIFPALPWLSLVFAEV